MPATDLPLLIDAARAAGQIALGYSGPEARRWEKPDGTGPVTEVDLAVNDMLEQHLRAARPDYGWLSEETEDDLARLEADRVFIVDPIDGTRSFAEGGRAWAHALAVADRGGVTAGVIYLPALDLIYTAALGQGARLNGDPIAPSTQATPDDARVLAARPVTDARYWRDGHAPGFSRHLRPSLAYRMGLVAQGRFDAMITLRPCWEWDVAAGDLILREAGAVCTDRRGGTLRFNNPRPLLDGVIAGGTALHRRFAAALRPA